MDDIGLAGRAVERARLRELLSGTGPRAGLVTGQPGLGVSALLDATAAAHPGPVRRARGASWETGRAGGVLTQLAGPVPGEDAFAAAEAVARACDPDARTLLVVDDAHDADVFSLQVLATLLHHHPGTDVTVLLGARPAGGADGTPDLLRDAAGIAIALRPLDAAAVARIAASRGVTLSGPAAERLSRHTTGVPRHVVALLDDLPDETWADPHARLPAPPEVAASVARRRAALPAGARDLVDVVAVLDQPGELDEIGAITGCARTVLEALTEAARAGLVIPAGSRWGPAAAPSDPMVREAVLDEIGPDAVAVLRRRAGLIVDDPTRRLVLIAGSVPGRDDRLAAEIEDRARAEAADGAWRTVARLLTEASRLTRDRGLREERVVRAVDALVGAGECRAAAALVPVVEATRETPLRGAVLGYLSVLLGRAGEASARLGRAWELTGGGESDPETAALVAQRLVLHALSRGRGDELVRWADRTIALAGTDSPTGIEAAAVRGLGLSAAGRVQEARRAYEGASEQVRRAQVQRVMLGSGWLHLVNDDLGRARSELETAVPTTALGGSARISLWALGWLARTRFLGGDGDGALQTVDRARALADRTGIALLVPLIEWTATQVHALRDEPEAAERAALAAEAGSSEYEVAWIPAVLARAGLAESRLDHPAVLRALEPLRAADSGSIVEPGWWPWTDLYAEALLMTGDLDGAEAFLRTHERRARERGHASTLSRLGAVRGRLYGARGDHEAAWAAFDEAVRLADALPHRWDRARSRFAYGQTLRRAGRRRDADTVLASARELFAGLGATLHVRRCDREMNAGGVRRGARGDRSATDLTPQERAVTGLVTAGRTNREAAAELQVSVKTIQYHLTRIYTKVGVRSRAELASRLSES